MARMEIRRPHGIGLEKARQSVQAVAEKLREDLKARYHWEGDGLRFDCPGAEGRIDVTGNEVCVVVSLSWLLAPVRGKIEHSINEYLDRYLV